MDTSFRLFPEQASTMAQRVDLFYFFQLAVTAFFTLLICGLILFFMLRYRRGRNVPRDAVHLGGKSNLLEIGWSIPPLVLTMVMFAWGAKLYFDMHEPPDNCLEITVVGKQWMWKIQHPEGKSEINELHIPQGRPVRLKMISEDVIHSFFIPAFRVKMDVLPDRYTSMWFEPTKLGEYHLFCAEYCGTSHSGMKGRVVVQEPAEYAAWLMDTTREAPELTGRQLFEKFRCNTCHTNEPDARCPSLGGLLGSRVQLSDGQTVLADPMYVRESILNPNAKIVAGYQPIMPSFQGQIGEESILQLIAYIKTLPALAPPSPAGEQPTPPQP